MFAIPHRQLNRRQKNPGWGKILIGAAVLGGGAYLISQTAKASDKSKTKVVDLAGKNFKATLALAPAPWIMVMHCDVDLKNVAVQAAKAAGIPRIFTISVEALEDPEVLQQCIEGKIVGAMFAGRMNGPVLEVLDGEDDERVFVQTAEEVDPKTKFAAQWAAGRLDDVPTQGMIKLDGDALWKPLNVEPPLIELRTETVYEGLGPTGITSGPTSITSSAPEVAQAEFDRPDFSLTTGSSGIAVLTLLQEGFERQMFVRVI